VALALYRKYRPRTFAEIIGQDHVTEPLSQALRSGRLHHAYLFSGPRGCGKTSSARILARSLNCEQGPTPEPCGVCASCKSLANDGAGSIDVIEIDAASHGGVDDARDLREKAFFAPASSRYKIYVIDEAHMVSPAGFNALLKLVEEPPEYVKFIFATTEPEKVLGTIRSRTHHYPFRLIPPAILRPYLQQLTEAEGIPVEPAVYPLVVRAGGGSARDTLSVLDQLIAGAGPDGVSYARAVALLGVTDVTLLDDMCDALAAGDGASAFATIDRVAEAGHDARRFASDLLERFRDLIVMQQVPDAVTKGLIDGPADQLEVMAAQATRLGPATLSRCADIVHNGLVDMRGTTAPRLLLELITARMLLPGADDSSGALLQRLERMERRLTLAGDPVRGELPPPPEPSDGEAVVSGGATGGASGGGGLSAARAAAAAAAGRRGTTGNSGGRAAPQPAPASATAAPVPAVAPAEASVGAQAVAGPDHDDEPPWDDEPEQDFEQAEPAPPVEPASRVDSASQVEAAPRVEAASRVEAAPRVEAASRAEPAPRDRAAPRVEAAPRDGAASRGDVAGRADSVLQGEVAGQGAGSSPAVPPQVTRRAEPAGVLPDAPEESGAAAVNAGVPGALDVTAVREVWPEIVTAIGRQSKKVAALASGATVRDLDGDTVVLTFRFPAHARMVAPEASVISNALYEALGGRWQIRCEVAGEGGTVAPTSGGPSRGSSSGNGGGPPRDGSGGSPAVPRAQAAAGSQQAVRASERAPQSRRRAEDVPPPSDDDWPEPAKPGGLSATGSPAALEQPADDEEDWPEVRAVGGPAGNPGAASPDNARLDADRPGAGFDGGSAASSVGPAGNPGAASLDDARLDADRSAAGLDGGSAGRSVGPAGNPGAASPDRARLDADHSGGGLAGHSVGGSAVGSVGAADGNDSSMRVGAAGGGAAGVSDVVSPGDSQSSAQRDRGAQTASTGSDGPMGAAIDRGAGSGTSELGRSGAALGPGRPDAAAAGSPVAGLAEGGSGFSAVGSSDHATGLTGPEAAGPPDRDGGGRAGGSVSGQEASSRSAGGQGASGGQSVGGGSAGALAAARAAAKAAGGAGVAQRPEGSAPVDSGGPAGSGRTGNGRNAAPSSGLAAARAAAAAAANARTAGGRPAGKPAAAGDSAWSDGSVTEEAPYDPEFDGPSGAPSYEGFDPGDEPLDDVIDEKTARESSEQQAMRLLQEAFGAEKIGES
jgi:DNA polymerase-3 subunit gamma/tau